MCGIFAYAGSKNAGPLIINGLKRLEYRGYDSWGIALLHQNQIKVTKRVGPIGNFSNLKSLPPSHIGIGHTRWATHGGVTQLNAHPHFSTDKTFVVAQNGIVENYQQLKAQLKKQHYHFESETDTEVIVRLIESYLKKGLSLSQATQKAFLKLEGRNTIIVLSNKNQQIIAIRHGSPLVVGLVQDELILASDTLSFANITNKVIFVNDKQMVNYLPGKLEFYDLANNKKINKKPVLLKEKDTTIDKQGYDSFYLKEVMEQPETIKNAILYSKKELQPFLQALKKANRIYILGAGSASFAAGQGAYFLRYYNHLNVTELKAYELKSFVGLFQKNDVVIAVSQSGETADTLEAIKFAKSKGAKVASIVNMLGSTLSRESDWPFFTRSGPEISVVSTKAFTAQVSWFLLISQCLANNEDSLRKVMQQTSKKIMDYSSSSYLKGLKSLAQKLLKKQHIYVLGRDEFFYIAQEAAMKIKEISYLHAEAFSAGELKHGVIALIDRGTPVMGIMPSSNQEEMLNALAQVKARGAFVIGVGSNNNELFDEWIKTANTGETQPIANLIPVQLLGYFLAKLKNLSPDKPRNLAKSVTVK